MPCILGKWSDPPYMLILVLLELENLQFLFAILPRPWCVEALPTNSNPSISNQPYKLLVTVKGSGVLLERVVFSLLSGRLAASKKAIGRLHTECHA